MHSSTVGLDRANSTTAVDTEASSVKRVTYKNTVVGDLSGLRHMQRQLNKLAKKYGSDLKLTAFIEPLRWLGAPPAVTKAAASDRGYMFVTAKGTEQAIDEVKNIVEGPILLLARTDDHRDSGYRQTSTQLVSGATQPRII